MVATQQHKSTIKQLQTKKNTIQIFFFLILLHRSLSINKKVYLKYVFILQFKKLSLLFAISLFLITIVTISAINSVLGLTSSSSLLSLAKKKKKIQQYHL